MPARRSTRDKGNGSMKEQNSLGGTSREWEKEGTEEHVREGCVSSVTASPSTWGRAWHRGGGG
jgi:hypothetical protein